MPELDPEKFIRSLEKKIAVVLAQSMQIPVNEIKILTPVDTGYLRNSVHGEFISLGDHKYMIYLTASYGDQPVEYAIYIELGTSKIAPFAMFRRGTAKAVPMINTYVQQALDEVGMEISEEFARLMQS